MPAPRPSTGCTGCSRGLLPGGAPVKKSTEQYKALLSRVRPRDLAGKTRRRMAAEEPEDLTRLDAKLKAMEAAVTATGSRLMDIHGIGPAGAARILADVGDIARFPDRNHFASRPAPPPSTPPAASTCATGSPAPETAATATCSTWPGSPAAQRHPRPRLLPPQARRRENPHRSHALPAPAPVRRRLKATGRRHLPPRRNEPGRAPRGVYHIQRGRPVPGHRHFGSATSWTRTPDALPPPPARATAHGPRSRQPPAARPRCQRGAPHRTNDVDTDQCRHTLNNGRAMPLTTPFMEGRHERAISPALAMHKYTA